MQVVEKYFPDLPENKRASFLALDLLYRNWNEKINVISRKDIDQLYLRHILHSLSIAKLVSFEPGTRILDVGTGGGFPGIPLAIFFPEAEFVLVDSIAKKIKVVNEISSSLKIKNVSAMHVRAEQVKGEFDFVVSRAVTAMPVFEKWVRKKISKQGFNAMANGILSLKGGDLQEELQGLKKAKIFNISDFFTEEFFATKKIVHLPQ